MTGSAPQGVEIVGVGAALPDRVLSNADLEKVMDTSDEWIVQRTGIRERRVHDPEKGPTTSDLATDALPPKCELVLGKLHPALALRSKS